MDSSDLSKLVSKKIGRNVDVVFCYKENMATPSFKLGLNIRGNSPHYALEIPKLDRENDNINRDNRKFAICSIISKAKKKYEFYMNNFDEFTPIAPPYLIPIPSFNISDEEFLQECEEFFAGFWSGDKTPLTDQQKSFLDTLKIVLLRSNDQNPPQKVPKFLRETFFKPLHASSIDPRVASPIQIVSVNQEAMGKEYNFSFYLYFKHE